MAEITFNDGCLVIESKEPFLSGDDTKVQKFLDSYGGVEKVFQIIVKGNVKEIGYIYFSDYINAKEIVIEEGIEKIGGRAFLNLQKLESVSLPSSLKEIGEGAFYGCSKIKEIKIPKNVKKLPEGIFTKCSSLTNVLLEEGLEIIDYGAFEGCDSKDLQTLTIPDSVEKIDYNDDIYDTSLSTINLGNGVMDLTFAYSPSGCSIKHINLKKDNPYMKMDSNGYIYSIDYKELLFAPRDITKLNLNEQCEILGDFSLSHCNNLTSVKFSNNIKEIGSLTFRECESLKEIESGASLAKINDGAFSKCKAIEKVRLGKNVKEFSSSSFTECNSLTKDSINIDKENPYFINDNGLVYSKDKKVLLCNCGNTDKEIKIDENTEVISFSAFLKCNTVQKIILGDNIKQVGNFAFSYCTNLKEISIPSSFDISKDALKRTKEVQISKR